MKVKISLEWLTHYVFRNHPNVKNIILDHDCIGEYQYDVNIKNDGKYGVRVGFFDSRFPRGKFYMTPTEGNYEIV